ncbi:hypothetical protein LRY65_03600 [Candidatus Woesebacteria bacterium]|nr:hypothetical protein [Candidatus Woesebacteria bacterium]MCD8506977.1 hypothetical protein [Candidatus Woesebacteria bacterium]MCD8527268.1 hypothetical protein [Candidatus Woesebacteria bacterium]MCD8546634.1 hypothetical protein [Candidatus Woesebacteria bacterium]
MQITSWMQKTARLTTATGVVASVLALTAMPAFAASFTLEENLLVDEVSEVIVSVNSDEAIDGLELVGTVTGVPVTDWEVEVFSDANLQVVSQTFSGDAFSVVLAPTELAESVTLQPEMPVVAFRFVPEATGEMVVTLDPENTIVAGTDSEGNIYTGQNEYAFLVPEAVLTDDSGMMADDSLNDQVLENVTSPALFHPGTLLIGVLAALVAVVAGLAWWRNSRRAGSAVPDETLTAAPDLPNTSQMTATPTPTATPTSPTQSTPQDIETPQV